MNIVGDDKLVIVSCYNYGFLLYIIDDLLFFLSYNIIQFCSSVSVFWLTT